MTKKYTLTARDLISGKKARQYRQKLASYADNRLSDSMLTLKFKLETQDDIAQSISFTDIRSLYSTIEGTDKGSLTYFLFTLILSGFRLFSNATHAVNFSLRSAFRDEEFQEKVIEHFGGELPNFTPSGIYACLAKIPRSSGTKDNTFKAETIEREYRNTLAKSISNEIDEEKISSLFSRIAQALASNFSTWNEIAKDSVLAGKNIDQVLSSFGNFPSLNAIFTSINSSLPDKSSIAFDKDSFHFDYEPEFAPYLAVASILSRSGAKRGKERDTTYIKNNLTTSTNNALAWLLNENTGLGILKNTPLNQLCEQYGIPKDRIHSMKQVQDAALALGQQNLLVKSKYAKQKYQFEPVNYSEFRTSFGGHIDSWTSNYVARLYEIKEILTDIPETLSLPKSFIINGKDFLSTTNVSRNEAETLIQELRERRKDALESVDRLLGRKLPVSSKDVETIVACSSLINRINAIYQEIMNAMEQASKDKQSIWSDLGRITKDDFKIWQNLSSIPKLNTLSGGVPNAEEELKQAAKLYKEIELAQREHFAAIKKWDEEHNQVPDIFIALKNKEQEKIQKRTADKNLNPKEQAIRLILDRIGRIVRQGIDEVSKKVVVWFDSQNIFSKKTDRNTYFCNQVKTLYTSPFSSRNQSALPINQHIINNAVSVLNDFDKLLKQLQNESLGYGSEKETLLKLEKLWMSVYLSSRVNDFPSEHAQLRLPSLLINSVPEELNLQLKQNTINNSTLSKAFNLYFSILSGLQTILRREQFYLRAKFTWIENNQLLYVPKQTTWAIPERYRNSDVWKPIFDSNVLQWANENLVDVKKTFDLLPQCNLTLDKIQRLLVQLPHDWCYELPFQTDTTEYVSTYPVSKDKKTLKKINIKQVSSKSLARLIGPSSMKSQLDSLILEPDSVSLSDMNLLIDQPVNQTVTEAGSVKLLYHPYQLTLAMPISRTITARTEKDFLFSRLVAIDQGEVGIGYAVFDLKNIGKKNVAPIATGNIRIPSIRRLIKGVRKFRKSGQQNQKFNQRFDATMFNLRKNVTGDVCGVIEGLMHKYNAFPVLEYQVKNFESGSKQLPLVYKAVNAHFTFSDVPMQNSKREAWWYKGNRWSTNWMRVRNTVDQRQSGSINVSKNINLFPGTTVSAWQTSQICSVCGRNATQLIARAKEENITQVEINQFGEVTLFNQTIRLYRKPTKKEISKAARLNERAEMNTAHESGTVSIEDLQRIIRYNLRRAPKSLMSKDTSQSQYYCVFADCEFHNKAQHADINAAINIGRRFLEETIENKTK